MSDLAFDPTGAPVLQFGAGPADWVAFLQQALASLQFRPGAADGDFGAGTLRAVQDFQAAAGLGADGIVGPQTWEALARALAAATTGAASAGRFDPASAPLLRRGDRGDWVRYLQELLVESGHDPGPVDGIFGPRTEAGVRSFQTAAGIDVDGVVGPQTWTALDPVAEAHSSDAPVGSQVIHGGGGATPGGAAGTLVTVELSAAAAVSDAGALDLGHTVHNGGAAAIRLIRIERQIGADDGSLSGHLEVGESVAGGASHTQPDSVPMGRAPDGETFSFTVTSVAVFDPGDGSEHHSAPAQRSFTVDDQGNVTEGGAGPPGGDGPSGPPGTHLSLSISTADRVVDGSLQLDFPVHNGSAENAVISGVDWLARSGSDEFAKQGNQGSPIGPGEDQTMGDVAPMGPAAGEPFQVTFTATVRYFLDDGSEHRSAPAEKTVTIDAEGVVGGSASAGGQGTPLLSLELDAGCAGDVLVCHASTLNNGDGAALQTRIAATLSGPLSDSREHSADELQPGEGIVAELGVQLPSDRTDTLLFVLEGTVSAANAAAASKSSGLSVAPDGSVSMG